MSSHVRRQGKSRSIYSRFPIISVGLVRRHFEASSAAFLKSSVKWGNQLLFRRLLWRENSLYYTKKFECVYWWGACVVIAAAVYSKYVSWRTRACKFRWFRRKICGGNDDDNDGTDSEGRTTTVVADNDDNIYEYFSTWQSNDFRLISWSNYSSAPKTVAVPQALNTQLPQLKHIYLIEQLTHWRSPREWNRSESNGWKKRKQNLCFESEDIVCKRESFHSWGDIFGSNGSVGSEIGVWLSSRRRKCVRGEIVEEKRKQVFKLIPSNAATIDANDDNDDEAWWLIGNYPTH